MSQEHSRVHYQEGDCFGVPLPDGGYALALVARIAPRGRVLFGYFFGPRRADLPNYEALVGLTPDRAVLALRFGDLGIVTSKWPSIGHIPDWSRDRWSMPAFQRTTPIDRRIYRVSYRDENPNSRPEERPITLEEAATLPEDGLFGSDALERKLGALLPSRRADG